MYVDKNYIYTYKVLNFALFASKLLKVFWLMYKTKVIHAKCIIDIL